MRPGLETGTSEKQDYNTTAKGRAIAQAVSRWLPTVAVRVQIWVSHVGFVVYKVALGQVFSEYFGFPCQSLFQQFLHNHHRLVLAAVPKVPPH
jgi:hypothetical protein